MLRYVGVNRRGPDFLLVGAQKAGTTFLYRALVKSSSRIVPAAKKEIHYFDGGIGRPRSKDMSPSQYCACFPRRPHYVLSGEASPQYLFHPRAAERIQAEYPSVKVIIILRDPVQRCLSHYAHEVRKGRESLPIEEALIRGGSEVNKLLAREDFDHPALAHKSYLAKGLYSQQIQIYLDTFPISNILILNFKDLVERTDWMIFETSKFLGVDKDQPIGKVKMNQTQNKIAPKPKLMDYLESYYERDRAITSNLISSLDMPSAF